MIVDLRWETEEERETVERLRLDWILYGQMHMTNAPRGHGFTRLDPTGITYSPPDRPLVRPQSTAKRLSHAR